MGTDKELSKVVLELEMDEDYNYLLGLVAFLYNAGLSKRDMRKVLGSSDRKMTEAIRLIRQLGLVDESLRYKNIRILYHRECKANRFTPSIVVKENKDINAIIYKRRPYIFINRLEMLGINHAYSLVNDLLNVFENRSKATLHFEEFIDRLRKYEKIKKEVKNDGA